jgi:transposase-like protein
MPQDQGAINPAPADLQVLAKPVRRRFSQEYKQRIRKEADTCTQPGQIGAPLRREGLYSSHLTDWRRQQQASGGGGRRRRQASDGRLAAENRELRRKTKQLERQLAQAEAIVELQKKVSSLLGIPLSTQESQENA